jgi:hypothetical protein
VEIYFIKRLKVTKRMGMRKGSQQIIKSLNRANDLSVFYNYFSLKSFFGKGNYFQIQEEL